MRHYNLDAAPLQCPHRTRQQQQQPQRGGENKLIFYLARRDSPHAMPRPQKEQDVEDAPPPPHAFCLPFYGHHQKRIKILLRQRERSTPSPSTPLAKVCPGVLNIKSTTTTMGRESGGGEEAPHCNASTRATSNEANNLSGFPGRSVNVQSFPFYSPY